MVKFYCETVFSLRFKHYEFCVSPYFELVFQTLMKLYSKNICFVVNHDVSLCFGIFFKKIINFGLV
jgi:hypothetical protein